MAISLNDHENRIKSFEDKLPDIENRINNIIATAKDYALVNLSESGSSMFNYDAKYNDYNYKVIEYGFTDDYIKCTVSGSRLYVKTMRQSLVSITLTWSRNTNVSIISCNSPSSTYAPPSSILVLFYK